MKDQLPPNSIISERRLLAGIFDDPKTALPLAMSALTYESFYDLRNGIIFGVMCAMSNDPNHLTAESVYQALKKAGTSDQAGGIAYLSEILGPESDPCSLDVPYLAEQIAQLESERRAVQLCAETIMRLNEGGGQEALSKFQSKAVQIKCGASQSNQKTMSELVAASIQKIEALWDNHGAISGLETGFPDLDRMIDGLQPGEMYVLAGYPGWGKTSFAINIVENVSVHKRQPAAIFSLEMSDLSLVLRLILSSGKVNPHAIRRQQLSEAELRRLQNTAAKIKSSPVHIEDTGKGAPVAGLCARSRILAQEQGIKLLVVDYLQLLHAPGADSRQEEVSIISRSLKNLARELSIPLIALSQLNEDGKLRESRAIGQDADGVWIIENDGKENTDDQDKPTPMRLVIMKNRNGPTGTVKLTFVKQFTRFESAPKVTQEDFPKGNYRQSHND